MLAYKPTAFLTVALLLCSPIIGQASGDTTPKIGVHVVSHVTKGDPCLLTPLPACNEGVSSLTTTAQLLTGYDLYILVLDGDSGAGVAGAAFGISHGPELSVTGWQRCATLDFLGGPPGASWPASGTGIIVTWDPQNNCQNQPAPGDSAGNVTAIAGSLYVYAYGDATFEITPRNYVQAPDLAVTSCNLRTDELPYPDNAGSVGFGSLPGMDPCEHGSYQRASFGDQDTTSAPLTFTEEFSLGNSSLWVSGREVNSPIQCRFADGVLYFNDAPVTFGQMEPVDSTELRTGYMRTFGDHPRVQELLREGVDILVAAEIASREFLAVLHRAAQLADVFGEESATHYLSSSPLIGRVGEITEEYVYAQPKGGGGMSSAERGAARGRANEHVAFRTTDERHHSFARNIVHTVRQRVSREGPGVLVTITSGGGVSIIHGPRRYDAEAQLRYVRENRTLSGLPPGPFTATERHMREVYLHVTMGY